MKPSFSFPSLWLLLLTRSLISLNRREGADSVDELLLYRSDELFGAHVRCFSSSVVEEEPEPEPERRFDLGGGGSRRRFRSKTGYTGSVNSGGDLDPLQTVNSKSESSSKGFVGDSLNRNMFVSLVCTLRQVAKEVKKWRRPASTDRGFTFVEYNIIVSYHRTNLLAYYGRQLVSKR